jgi:hypothetical protein
VATSTIWRLILRPAEIEREFPPDWGREYLIALN